MSVTASSVLMLVLAAAMFMMSGFSETSATKRSTRVAAKKSFLVEQEQHVNDLTPTNQTTNAQLELPNKQVNPNGHPPMDLPDASNGLEGSVEALTRYIVALLDQLKTATIRADGLVAEKEALGRQLSAANAFNNDLLNQLKTLQTVNATLQQNTESPNDQVVGGQAKTETVQHGDTSNAIDELNQQLSDVQSSLTEAQSVIDTLTTANAALSNKIDEVAGERDALSQVLADQQKHTTLDNPEQQQQEGEDIQSKPDSLQAAHDTTNAELERTLFNAADLQSQLDASNESNINLQASIDILSANLASSNSRVDALTILVGTLKNALDNANGVLQDYANHINGLLGDLSSCLFKSGLKRGQL